MYTHTHTLYVDVIKRFLHSFSTESDGGSPAILQVAPINVVEHSVCSQPEWWGSIALETMVCAGGDGIIAGCQVEEVSICFPHAATSVKTEQILTQYDSNGQNCTFSDPITIILFTTILC